MQEGKNAAMLANSRLWIAAIVQLGNIQMELKL